MQQQQPPAHSVHLPGPNNYQAGGPPAPHGTCNPYYGFHHQQPQQPRPPAVGQWSTGLCGAHGEYLNCLVTHFCPWITFGQIAEIVDEGTTSCCAGSLLFLGVHCCFGCCFTPMVTYVYRARIRQKFNIPPGKCCGDFCLHFWCECFALRQEWRELKRRGLDPSLGWEAIIRRSQQVMQAPVWPPQMISSGNLERVAFGLFLLTIALLITGHGNSAHSF